MDFQSLNAATRWGLGALVLMGVVFGLYFGRAIFVPMTIALLLVAVLWPLASWVSSSVTMPGVISSGKFPWVNFRLVPRQLPWGITCLIVIVLLVAIILLVPLGLGMAVNNILKDVPRDGEQLDKAYTKFRVRMVEALPVLDDQSRRENLYLLGGETVASLATPDFPSTITQLVAVKHFEDAFARDDHSLLPLSADQLPLLRGVQEVLSPNTPAFGDMLKNVLAYGGNWVIEGVLIMFMLLFLLLEGRLLSKRVVEVFGPTSDAQSKAVKVLENMAEQVRVYLVWRTIVNFGLALVLGVVYWFMGLKFNWQWALLTAFLCYIPYLGQIVAGIPPFFDALIYAPSPWMALAVLSVYIFIMVVEGYIIVPIVMGRSMQLNAITVLLACSFWFLVWGTPGLFLAMPLMAAIKAICANVPGLEVWANLMSTVDPEPKPPDAEGKPVAAGQDLGDTEIMSPAEAQAHRVAIEAMQRNKNS